MLVLVEVRSQVHRAPIHEGGEDADLAVPVHDVVAAVVAAALAAGLMFFLIKLVDRLRKKDAETEARRIIERAEQAAASRVKEAELETMMASRNTQFQASGERPDGIENVGQYNYVRKFSAEFSLEMTRSVRAMLQSWCS